LGSLVAAAKRLSDLGGALIIARPTGLVKEVFAISKLDTVIPVVPDVPTGVARNAG
jgi:anti-anti-sigma regulatory factor